MPRHKRMTFRWLRSIVFTLSFAGLALTAVTVWAGFRGFRNGAVGGVSIDATGVVAEPIVESRARLIELMRKRTDGAPDALEKVVPIRMISLRGLEEAIAEARKNGLTDLPDEIQYLAGLQRIQYVFLYPEQDDIVLAGPAEGWEVDDMGNVVGITTGRPVIQLDDLLVAFRSVNHAGEGRGISCSIDPTAAGRRKFNAYMSKAGTIRGFNRKAAAEALGMQQISVTGVPADSHFARVMVACDFRMKQYAMNLQESPVGVPSYLDLLKSRRGRVSTNQPRWWMACNYDKVGRSEDGLAWQLRGQGVKVMTEQEFVAADGTVSGTGKADPIAQAWSDMFTEKYEELTAADPVFGELRNIMDLCVVAALIEKHEMLQKVGLQLPLIKGESSPLSIEQWNAPRQVASRCSTMKVGRKWIITASGGVQIESWEAAEHTEMLPAVQQIRSRAARSERTAFWWN